MNMRGGISNALVRPGSSLVMFTWNAPAAPNAAFAALRGQMANISYSACYCSVFDECYVRSDDDKKPEPVEQCVAPAVRFQPTFGGTSM